MRMLLLMTMPQADDGDLGRASADVDDHAAGRLADGKAGPDRGRHRLFDQARPAGARVHRRITHGPLLDLGHAGRDTQEHARARDQPDSIVHLAHEVLDHLLGHVEVADDSVAERPDGDDVRGVRPTIRFASAPIASTFLVLVSSATTLGSLITIPRSLT